MDTNTTEKAWKRALAALRADNALRYDAPDAPFKWSPGCLSDLADCSQPNTEDGTYFLRHIAYDFCDRIAYTEPESVQDVEDLRDLSTDAADGAIPVYTHRKWAVFVDVAAYIEDVSGLVQGKREITGDDIANAALFIIADRLFQALCNEYAEKLEAELEADEDTVTE